MQYRQAIQLKDGRECILRSGTATDGQAAMDCFVLTHSQTDELFSYPDEIHLTPEKEARFLTERAESADELEILAEVDGRVVGLAGLDRIGRQAKVRHRVNFGISIDRAYWGLGIGRAMTKACIACAKEIGYAQVELEVVAENRRAIALYESEGFREYGRNPKGFRSRFTGWQEIVLMRLDLTEDENRERRYGRKRENGNGTAAHRRDPGNGSAGLF
ncbi:MAG: GNAT family N-acetyltransferase [Clostridia bacterium]|nr:GNAT family N-acetyltransferase [Clostridia bacterium]